jgi:hypothetical protein
MHLNRKKQRKHKKKIPRVPMLQLPRRMIEKERGKLEHTSVGDLSLRNHCDAKHNKHWNEDTPES